MYLGCPYWNIGVGIFFRPLFGDFVLLRGDRGDLFRLRGDFGDFLRSFFFFRGDFFRLRCVGYQSTAGYGVGYLSLLELDS